MSKLLVLLSRNRNRFLNSFGILRAPQRPPISKKFRSHPFLNNVKQRIKGFPLMIYPTNLCLLSFLFWSQTPDNITSSKDNEQIKTEIKTLLKKSEEYILDDNLKSAKKILQEALDLSESSNLYYEITNIYELLAIVVFKEGNFQEAEDMLVRFIEKLQQLGYSENHNSIIRFKLKLSRLYEMVGNTQMAEIGFKNCIDVQEKKLMTIAHEEFQLANGIYVSCLFWYGLFLFEQNKLIQAKEYLMKSLKQLDKPHHLGTNQIMVIHYHNAEVCTRLKEFDLAIAHIIQALALCKQSDVLNPDLPNYLVKLGVLYLYKGMADRAEFWCDTANKFAKHYHNDEAEEEAQDCLKKILTLERNKNHK